VSVKMPDEISERISELAIELARFAQRKGYDLPEFVTACHIVLIAATAMLSAERRTEVKKITSAAIEELRWYIEKKLGEEGL